MVTSQVKYGGPGILNTIASTLPCCLVSMFLTVERFINHEQAMDAAKLIADRDEGLLPWQT